MNTDRDLASVLAEATEAYRTRGTLGDDADAFNRVLAARLEEARQHAAACEALHDAVCRGAENGGFRSGDYMVYFTLAFHLKKVSLAVIFRALFEAARLSTTTEFGLAWDLVLVVALALSIAQPSQDTDDSLHLGELFATVLTFPIPNDRASELPSNIAAVLGRLPPYMAVPIFNATAHGLRKRQPRYDVLAWIAHNLLSDHLTATQRVIFIIQHWLPAIDASTAPELILDQAMTSAIIALEDAHPTGSEVDLYLRALQKQLVKYPLRARVEFSRHLVRLAIQLSASRTVVAVMRVQRAHWVGNLDRTEAAYELRQARALWRPEELPPDIEINILFAEAAMAYQRRDRDEALRLADRAVDRASVVPELLAVAESRRHTLRMMFGVPLDPGVTVADPSYIEHVSRLVAEAVAAFRNDQLQRCIELVGEALALPRPDGASEAQYTRRRAYLLRAAAHFRAGDIESSLGSVLDAIDELTEGIRRHVSGTEQAARRDRFAEVEALLDRCLQIVAQASPAFGWAAFERLWEWLVRYRDIELEFNDSILRAHGTATAGAVENYRQTRDMLAALQLDGCAKAPGRSDAAAIARYARLTDAVGHNLYNLEVTLSDTLSYGEAVRRRLRTRLSDIVAELRDEEMLVEFVSFWSGLIGDGVGVRSLMAFTISATEPERLVVIVDRRTCPPPQAVVQALLELDRRHSESVDLPVSESDLAQALMRRAQDTHVRRLLCVPDGPVRLMNLAALPYTDGHLGDHLDIVYLGHATDLLLEPSMTVPGPSAVFGDADFDRPLSQSAHACISDGRPPMQFPDLPATAAEAGWVAEQLGARPTTRDQVTAPTFRALRSPLVLHIATHGVFDEGYARPSLAATGGHGHNAILRATAGSPRLAPERPMDPALRSGVALTGINWWLRGLPCGDDSECGYVSAYDVSWMDLTGTRLAVFSGCRTGRGPDERYLGLVDLRRAVRVAGAWEVIAAIWNVPDTASALLMRLMYSCANDGIPTAEDLGRAQRTLRHASVADIRSWVAEWPIPPTFGGPYLREILQQPPDHCPFADPYYWAGFVCYTTGRVRQPRQRGNDLHGNQRHEHQPADVRGPIR